MRDSLPFLCLEKKDMPSEKLQKRFLLVAALLAVAFFLFLLLPGSSKAQAVQEALIGTYSQSPTVPAVPNPTVEGYRTNTSFGPVVSFPRAEGLPVDWSQIRRDRLSELAGKASTRIHFEFDSSELKEGSETSKALAHLAALLESNPDVGLVLTGHADKVGPQDYNLELGKRRAEAVSAALIERGITPKRLRVASLGEDAPAVLVVGLLRENRRVEVELFDVFTQ